MLLLGTIIGKLHEICLYGLLVNIISIVCKKVDISTLWNAAMHVDNFATFFYAYLFWASVLFIPIAVIGALYTKYVDKGEGLSFASDKLLVILFAHIGEELLGLVLTPFWFLKDLIKHTLRGIWKKIDYIMYAVEVIVIVIGVFFVIL